MSPLSGSPVGHSAAFDEVARDYDRTFSHRVLGRWLRQAVHQHLGAYVAGDRVIELGCGTGEDTLWLAQRGVRVVALDASAAMLSVAAGKLERAGLADHVRLEQIDLNVSPSALRRALAGDSSVTTSDTGSVDDSDTTPVDAPTDDRLFDGCLSNFGALNCVDARPALAAEVASVMRPDAPLTVVVMGPFCPWEIAWFTSRGRLPSACRRWRGRVRARVGDHKLAVDYPTPRRLRRELEPWFRALGARGLGVLLPPTQLAHLVDRWPRASARLRRWENRIAGLPPAAWLSDHYLLQMRRRGPQT